MFRKLREQGDGVSGDSAVAKPASLQAPISEPTPVAPVGAKEPTVAELQAQIAGLKKTVGDQGNEIGGYKKAESLTKQEVETHRAFMYQLKKSPAETLKSLNLAAGLTVSTPGVELVLSGDPVADQTAQINAIVNKALADNMGPFNSIMNTVHETHLASKYGEGWDELAQVRNANEARIRGNQIPVSELAHIVSEFGRMAQHIQAAKTAGREELRAELEMKANQHLADPTGQEPRRVPENEQTAFHAAKKLGNSW